MSVRYMLDTNMCTYIIKNSPVAVRQKFEVICASDLVLSMVTLAKLRYGAEKLFVVHYSVHIRSQS
jgi:tRNA(fMet)-specific endonuclease VapC